jgi:four helix bundle protein
MTVETEVRSFRDLQVWQRAIELGVAVYALTDKFPPSERFGLTSQIRRAATSVAANIAEGHARSTRRDYSHFLAIARGSLSETRTYLEFASRLGYLSRNEVAPIENLATEVNKMLVSLRSRLTPRASDTI